MDYEKVLGGRAIGAQKLTEANFHVWKQQIC